MTNSTIYPTEKSTTANLDKWLADTISRVKKLEQEISRLNNENQMLTKKVRELEDKSTQQNSSPVALYSSIAKIGTPANAAIVRAIKQNEKMEEDRATKVVMVGISESQTEEEDVQKAVKVIRALNTGKNIIIKSVRRLKKKPSKDQAGTTVPYAVPLVVEVESKEIRNEIVASAKNLSKLAEYKNTYIRPDRTPAEQTEFINLYKARNNENDNLKKNNKLDNPFRYVIRGDRIRCIDTTVTVEINGVMKHPFVDPKVVKEALNNSTNAGDRGKNIQVENTVSRDVNQ